MNTINTDFVRQKWHCKPEFSTADTSDIANEIQKRLDKMFKEHTMDDMTYCGKPVVDISPGVNRAYVKFMDNLLYIDRPRELGITHESLSDGVTLELKCDMVHSQKLYDTYDATRIYNPDKRLSPTRTQKPIEPTPKKVIFSGPATTILWKDGTKTTVKCQNEDAWDDDVGVAMCYLKKMLGNKGNFNNIFREAAKVSDGCGWGFAKGKNCSKDDFTSSTAIEGESYYRSALDSMKRNIDEINDFMKDAADALDKALGGKK